MAAIGKDPQRVLDDAALGCDAAWTAEQDASAFGGVLWFTETKDAAISVAFEGNQV